MIYLDNAATSWPKPETVGQAMMRFLREVGANPGRSGHRLSIEAGRIILDARENVAKLFNLDDPMRVVFGLNATDGLNLGIRGILKKGDHVITGSMEHNSVMRPLRDLEAAGVVDLTVVQCSGEGFLDPQDVSGAMRKNTKMVVVNHGSNIVGSLAPVREIGKVAREGGALFMIDAAQTAGCIPIDMKADNIDMVGFTGHKGLLGPMGTGGLAIDESVTKEQLSYIRSGGTGSKSEFEKQPDFFPDKYESGTSNTVGLAGLAAGVRFVLDETVEKIHGKEMGLTRRLLDGLKNIPKVRIFGGLDETKKTSTVSINIEDMSQSDVGLKLDEDFEIMSRVGLHCAPTAHKTIGTFPDGTVRLAMGYFINTEDVDYTIGSLTKIAGA